MNWNQPVCERCWIMREGVWEAAPEFGDLEGEILTGVRMPSVLREPVLEQCAWCGGPTIVGIYQRADPATVAFPAADDDEIVDDPRESDYIVCGRVGEVTLTDGSTTDVCSRCNHAVSVAASTHPFLGTAPIICTVCLLTLLDELEDARE